MTDITAPFVAGHLALDFLNTAPRFGAVECLDQGVSLRRWMAAAGLPVADQIDGHDASAARRFRETMRPAVTNNAGGEAVEIDGGVADAVNRILAKDVFYFALKADHSSQAGRPVLEMVRPKLECTEPLGPIAEAFGRLFSEADFTRVKTCENPRCSLLFLDTSLNRTRRWCSMTTCGNQAKVAAHRSRRRADRG
jgi:predicted RNA-binding Zn ribbon-like protein